jgi:hypothetical protein
MLLMTVPIPIAVQMLLRRHHRIHSDQHIGVKLRRKLEANFALLPELFQRLGRPAREAYIRAPMISGLNKGAILRLNDEAAPDF